MTIPLKSAFLAAVMAAGLASGAQAATVSSVTVPFSFLGGLFHTVTQSGEYRLDFSGEGTIPESPDYLGFAGYVLDGPTNLAELIAALGQPGASLMSVFDGISSPIFYLEEGYDFAAAIAATAGTTTVDLVLVDAPAPVPLPASLPLLAAAVGITGLAARRRLHA
ncbi:hypothetical protein [uncultured Paracoccus sp.]|uniref:hypothetical protein n=1 Tax=uncultured Paracoccus sp. TaxID=189685 RepID=UPI0025E98474|nr:hypothetical protein [uncultured Paracoccus sp.]